MRLQLSSGVAQLLALSLLLPGGTALAQEIEEGTGKATSKFSIYQDDDATTVVTSMVDGQVAVEDGTELGAHVLVDTVSSASVDVVSAATPRFEETRVEFGLRAKADLPGESRGTLAYVHSQENDWQSHAVQLGLSRELAQKNATISGALGLVGNKVGRSGDPTFQEESSAVTFELSLTQLIDRRSLASLTLTHQRNSGWQSSPYRYVTTRDGSMSRLENHPSARARTAVTLHGARYVATDTAVTADYRLYRDDWGLLSHTFMGALTYAPGEAWEFRLRARYYGQGAARFWRMYYDDPMQYMTADRELSTFWNASVGGRIARHFGGFVADAKVDVVHYRFVELENLGGRRAIVATAGLGYGW